MSTHTPAEANPTVVEFPAKKSRKRKAFTGAIQDFTYSDMGNAELLVHRYGANWRYDHRQQRWLEWDKHKKRWHEDTTNRIAQFAVMTARYRRQMAAEITDSVKANQAFKWATKSENRHQIISAIDLARGLPPVADPGDGWDADPWLFGVANGVVDLRTGKLRDECQDDRITKHSPVRYDPNAKCPRFLAFIEEVLCRDAALIDYMQTALGYCLTGSIIEECVFCWYGKGANGKTTLQTLWGYLLGDHHVNLPFSAVETKTRNSSDLVCLTGARFATAVETNEGTRLNEARIKAITGGDPITACAKFKMPFTFPPTHKLVLAFNHKPTIADDSEGMWRRVHLVPFNRYFAEHERDKNLLEKLKDEAPGILAWAVRGCLKWQKEGLTMPPAVKEATTTYRDESDHVGEFLADCCILESGAEVTSAALWKRYQEWTHDYEEVALSRKAFTARLSNRGLVPGRDNKTRGWTGVRLKPPAPAFDPTRV